MRRVGVFGGTFDPVHVGHLILAEAALDEAKLSKVLFMPAFIQPFKIGKTDCSGNDRLEMLLRACEGNSGFSVTKIELEAAEISYTINSLREIKNLEGDDAKIHFISGTDSFLNLEKWYKSDELLKEFSFIVGVRPGYKNLEVDNFACYLKETYGTETIKLNNCLLEISSTDIKERVRSGRSIKYIVPEPVEHYIKENSLYL